jgi:cell division protein FtsB
MRALAFTLTVAFLLLQHRLWLSGDGWRAVQGLKQELSAARGENTQLEARNLRLLRELGYLAGPAAPQGSPGAGAGVPPQGVPAAHRQQPPG